MTNEGLLNLVAEWFFSDEKWWDIVGLSACRYVKAQTKTEAKMQNQIYLCLLFLFVVVHVDIFRLICSQKPHFKSKKGGVKK